MTNQDRFEQEASTDLWGCVPAIGVIELGTELKDQLSPESHHSELRDREESGGKTQAALWGVLTVKEGAGLRSSCVEQGSF